MKKAGIGVFLIVIILCTACSAGKNETKSTKKGEEFELTVYTLKDDPNLWQSAVSFEKANPGYEIKIEIGVSKEDAITRSDAIRNLNTELMAGEGPDVIFLDGLPIEEYIKKGILADISDSINVLKKNGEVLFENVASAYERKGKVYAIPAFFSIPIVVGEKDKVNAEDVKVILKKGNRISDQLMHGLAAEPERTIPLILLSSWDEMFSEEKVDKELLKIFLETSKTVMENSDIDLNLEYYKECPPFESMINNYPKYEGSVTDISFGKNAIVVEILSNILEGATIQSLNAETPIFYQYLNQENGKKFIPEQILGVNDGSDHKKAAQKFTEYFLSEQNMNRDGYKGNFTTNKTWLEKQLPQSEEKKYMTTFYPDQEQSNSLEVMEFNKKEADAFLQFLNQAEEPLNVDQLLLEEVLMQTKKYVYEGASLESSMNIIQEKIQIYQAE